MEYFEKIEKNPFEDLFWNLPEQKQGEINVVGGNNQSFNTEIKVAELITSKYPVKNVTIVLPDGLKNTLPPLPNFKFLPSISSGSFSESEALKDAFNAADFNLLIGDFSKNSITKEAVGSACVSSEKPLFLTRDTIDLVAEFGPEKILKREGIILLGSLVQLQKLLRSIYYPKMLLLSQSLVQVADILHKFTLSYPVTIITLHNGQILVAKNGKVYGIPLTKTKYSPITLWAGELAARIAVLCLFNPGQFNQAAVAALF